MNLKMSDYPHIYAELKQLLRARPDTDKIKLVTEFCAANGTPLIVAFYTLNSMGYRSNEIDQKLEELLKFYDIKEVVR